MDDSPQRQSFDNNPYEIDAPLADLTEEARVREKAHNLRMNTHHRIVHEVIHRSSCVVTPQHTETFFDTGGRTTPSDAS